MTLYRINGVDLSVHEIGEDINGTIIAVHGGRGMGNYRTEFRAWSPLAEHGYRVIAFDQRGHGDSSVADPLTYEQLADDIEALRKQLVGKPAIVLGGSFGGFIALTYAVKYQGSYSHLVLRGTAPSWHHEHEAIANAERAGKDGDYIRRMFAGDIEGVAAWQGHLDDNASLAEGRLYAHRADKPAVEPQIRLDTGRELFRIGHDFDVRDRLSTITAPTLIVVGSEDWTCTPNQARLMAEGIPNSELLIVEGAPHGVHVDSGDLVRARLLDFLSQPVAA